MDTAPTVSSENPNDARLTRQAVSSAKAGDSEGVHYLYVRYADDVLRYVTSIVRDRSEAEFITQNVFAKMMTAIQKYEERSVPFTAWIMRVARNAALDHLRAKRPIPTEEVRLADNGSSHTATERARDLREALRRPAGRPARSTSPSPRLRPHPNGDRRHPEKDRELSSRPPPPRPPNPPRRAGKKTGAAPVVSPLPPPADFALATPRAVGPRLDRQTPRVVHREDLGHGLVDIPDVGRAERDDDRVAGLEPPRLAALRGDRHRAPRARRRSRRMGARG